MDAAMAVHTFTLTANASVTYSNHVNEILHFFYSHGCKFLIDIYSSFPHWHIYPFCYCETKIKLKTLFISEDIEEPVQMVLITFANTESSCELVHLHCFVRAFEFTHTICGAIRASNKSPMSDCAYVLYNSLIVNFLMQWSKYAGGSVHTQIAMVMLSFIVQFITKTLCKIPVTKESKESNSWTVQLFYLIQISEISFCQHVVGNFSPKTSFPNVETFSKKMFARCLYGTSTIANPTKISGVSRHIQNFIKSTLSM